VVEEVAMSTISHFFEKQRMFISSIESRMAALYVKDQMCLLQRANGSF